MERFLYGSPDYQAHMREHVHPRGEKDFLESVAKRGMVAVDVGGYVGFTACAISRAIGETGRLFCFEPVAKHRNILKDNVRANGLTNIEVVPAAVGKESGTTSLYVDGGGTSIVPSRQRDRVVADVVCLDDFFEERGLRRLDLLNMDCEGSELLVLQGARTLLSHNPATIFVETHHDSLKALGQSVRAMVAFLDGLGYEVSSVSLSDLRLGEDWEDCEYLYARR